MDVMNEYSLEAAGLIARLLLGTLFLFQGYDAVVRIGLREVNATYRELIGEKNIPPALISFAGSFTSITELLCGFLIIPGIAILPCLYLLGINLVVASVGFGLSKPLWDEKHVFVRLALVLFLLCSPASAHHFSLDQLIFK